MQVSTTPSQDWAGLVPQFDNQSAPDFSQFMPEKDVTLNELTNPDASQDALTNQIINSVVPSDKGQSSQGQEAPIGTPLDDTTGGYINRLVEEGVLLGFENGNIETYEDFKELISLNAENIAQQATRDVFSEQLRELPPQFQSIMKYGLNGGQDIQGLLNSWAEAERTIGLDMTTLEGQEEIVATYLNMINYGTPEQIAADIEMWKDLGYLQEKAEAYKPKLDEFQMQQILAKEQEAEHYQQQVNEFNNAFVNNVGHVLSNDTNYLGIQIPDQFKQAIYNQAIPQYASQIDGRQIDALEAIVEETKYGQNANPAFYTELLFHATYPEEYKKMLRSQISAEIAQNTRRLKTNQVQADMGRTNHTSSGQNSKIKPIQF